MNACCEVFYCVVCSTWAFMYISFAYRQTEGSDGKRMREREIERESSNHLSEWDGQWGMIEQSHSQAFFLDNGQRPYEDWYKSARLALLDHQTDWYYTPSLDEDKVSVIILNRRACQGRKIRPCRWLQERSADCHADLSRRVGRCWKNSVRLRTELHTRSRRHLLPLCHGQYLRQEHTSCHPEEEDRDPAHTEIYSATRSHRTCTYTSVYG